MCTLNNVVETFDSKWAIFVNQLEIAIYCTIRSIYVIICVTRQPPVIVSQPSIFFEQAVFRRLSNRLNMVSYKQVFCRALSLSYVYTKAFLVL